MRASSAWVGRPWQGKEAARRGGPRARPARCAGARSPLVVVVVLALAVASAGGATAQQDPEPLSIWLAGGPVAGGAVDSDANFGAQAHLTAEWGPNHLSLRTLAMGDFSSFPDGGSDDVVGELGLLYGRVRSASAAGAYVSWAAGVSVVTRDGGVGPDIPRHTIGLPLTAEAGLQATVIGAAIQAFANLNPDASYGGLGLVVQFGWMR